VIALATAVAAELSALRGTPWHARALADDGAELLRFDGARLILRALRYPPHAAGLVEVRACFPPDRWDSARDQRPRVSPRRPAVAIARHLGRPGGFLDWYDREWSREAKRDAARARRLADDVAFLADVAERGNGRVDNGQGARDARAIVAGLEVRPLADGCEVRGVLPREVALRVAGMLRG